MWQQHCMSPVHRCVPVNKDVSSRCQPHTSVSPLLSQQFTEWPQKLSQGKVSFWTFNLQRAIRIRCWQVRNSSCIRCLCWWVGVGAAAHPYSRQLSEMWCLHAHHLIFSMKVEQVGWGEGEDAQLCTDAFALILDSPSTSHHRSSVGCLFYLPFPIKE